MAEQERLRRAASGGPYGRPYQVSVYADAEDWNRWQVAAVEADVSLSQWLHDVAHANSSDLPGIRHVVVPVAVGLLAELMAGVSFGRLRLEPIEPGPSGGTHALVVETT